MTMTDNKKLDEQQQEEKPQLTITIQRDGELIGLANGSLSAT
jgi:hypothetical protein